MNYPNQKKVTINKSSCSVDKKYAKLDIPTLRNAMLNIRDCGALKLWLYLAKNKKGYEISLSCIDCGNWGIKPDSYHRAVKKLIEKGYLKQISGNQYIFDEGGVSIESQ